MILSYASNAVLSKARAMYGKRLSDKSYEELLSCRNISDIASYLKKKTNYKDVLSKINENHVHRRELESGLKSKLFIDFETLARYDISVGEHFYEYLISRAEIEHFMKTLMFMSAGKCKKDQLEISDFFLGHTKVDLRGLSNIQSYDDLLKAVKKSVYFKILFKFKPKDGETLNINAIETALHNHLHQVVFKIINKYVKGKAQKELKSFFELYTDLSNMIRIVRMKKFYKLTPEYMMNSLIEGGALKAEKIKSFVEASTDKQMMIEMKNTSLGKKWFSRNLDVVDKVPINMRFNWCKHNIRFSISPPIVLISYVFLKEVEILNVITIIEGVKYKLSPEEIRKMLIK